MPSSSANKNCPSELGKTFRQKAIKLTDENLRISDRIHHDDQINGHKSEFFVLNSNPRMTIDDDFYYGR